MPTPSDAAPPPGARPGPPAVGTPAPVNHLADALARVTDGVVVLDRAWRYVYVNAAAERLLGRPAGELVGRDYHALWPEAIDQPFYRAYRRAMETGEPAVFEDHYAPWDRWFENRLYPGPDGLTIIFTEITDRRREERALRARERRQSLVLGALAVGTWAWDVAAGTVTVDAALANVLGTHALCARSAAREAASGAPAADTSATTTTPVPAAEAVVAPEGARTLRLDVLLPAVHDDDRAALAEAMGTVQRTGGSREATFRLRHADGGWRWLHAVGRAAGDLPNGADAPHAGSDAASPAPHAAGARLVVGAVRDVTTEHESRSALHEVEGRLAAVFEAVGTLVWTWGLDDNHVTRRGDLLLRLGYALEELPPEGPAHAAWWFAQIHPDDRAAQTAHLDDVREGRMAALQLQFRFRRRDGSWAVLDSTSRLERDPAGRPWRMVGVVVDVSARAEADRARRELEAQLRQSQKLQALGQLAGGVAHDFNNLLQVIRSHVGFARDEARAGRTTEALDDLDAIAQASDRAMALTRQLLAVGRQQVLQPRVLDLNAVVRGLLPMLGRTLGARIAVHPALDPALAPVHGDPGQLEQVLLNLVVNARDAMPDGGRLEIVTGVIERAAGDLPTLDGPVGDGPAGDEPMGDESADAPARALSPDPTRPTRWVCLTVRDTGVGMDEATRARAFEPFFTTKEPGKGTGLGLATVYGIVRQSGGWVRLDSAPGRGTAVHVELPAHAGAPIDAAPGGVPNAAADMASDVAPDVVPNAVPDVGPAAAPDVETGQRPDATATGAAHGAAAPPAGPPPAPRRGTVLLVDDDAAVRRATRRMLERAGYAVREAGDDATALGRPDDGALRPDLVVTDVMMPGLGGRALAERLRERWPDVPVLFVSGHPDDATLQRALSAPGAAYLAKPFSMDALLGAVAALVPTPPAARSDG